MAILIPMGNLQSKMYNKEYQNLVLTYQKLKIERSILFFVLFFRSNISGFQYLAVNHI